MSRSRSTALFATLTTGAALGLAGAFPVSNPDTFGHLAAGRQIAELGRVPRVDAFSFFRDAPQPWANYEWLSDLGMWGAYALGGLGALWLLKLALLFATGALLPVIARGMRGDRAAVLCAVLVVLAIPTLRGRLSERPHLLGLLFEAILLAALVTQNAEPRDASVAARRERLVVGGLAAMHLVWVNSHGSHLLGLATVAIALATSFDDPARRRPLAALFGLDLAASCLSPYGPAIVVDAVAHLAGADYRLFITEWQPWGATMPLLWLATIVGMLLLLLLAARPLVRGAPLERAGVLVALGLALLAFRSIRFYDAYLLVAAPVVAAGLVARFDGVPRRRAAAWALAPIALFAAALPTSFGTERARGLGVGPDFERLPAAAGAFLAEHHPSPRLFAAMEDAWYALFAVPGARVLIDGRAPFYGLDHLRLVNAAQGDPALFRRLVERFRVDTILLRHVAAHHRSMLEATVAMPSFRLYAIEDRFALFGAYESPPVGPSPFEALPPSYDVEALWSEGADVAAMRAELARLRHPNTRAYVRWAEASLALRPLLRGGPHDGLRRPRSAAERATVTRAADALAHAARVLDDVPVVQAEYAMAALADCRLEVVEGALELALREGASREPMLTRLELLRERGETDEVRGVLDALRAEPASAGDPWITAIRRSLDEPPRCR